MHELGLAVHKRIVGAWHHPTLGQVDQHREPLSIERVEEVPVVVVPVLEQNLGGVLGLPALGGDVEPGHPPR